VDCDDLEAFLDLDEYMEDTEGPDTKRTSGQISPDSLEADQATCQPTETKLKHIPPSPKTKALDAVHDGQLTESRNGSNFTKNESIEAPYYQPSRNYSPFAEDLTLQPAVISTAKTRETDEDMIALNNANAEAEEGADFLDDLDKWLEDSVALEQ
jgi:hypothetical protein